MAIGTRSFPRALRQSSPQAPPPSHRGRRRCDASQHGQAAAGSPREHGTLPAAGWPTSAVRMAGALGPSGSAIQLRDVRLQSVAIPVGLNHASYWRARFSVWCGACPTARHDQWGGRAEPAIPTPVLLGADAFGPLPLDVGVQRLAGVVVRQEDAFWCKAGGFGDEQQVAELGACKGGSFGV